MCVVCSGVGRGRVEAAQFDGRENARARRLAGQEGHAAPSAQAPRLLGAYQQLVCCAVCLLCCCVLVFMLLIDRGCRSCSRTQCTRSRAQKASLSTSVCLCICVYLAVFINLCVADVKVFSALCKSPSFSGKRRDDLALSIYSTCMLHFSFGLW